MKLSILLLLGSVSAIRVRDIVDKNISDAESAVEATLNEDEKVDPFIAQSNENTKMLAQDQESFKEYAVKLE